MFYGVVLCVKQSSKFFLFAFLNAWICKSEASSTFFSRLSFSPLFIAETQPEIPILKNLRVEGNISHPGFAKM